MTSWLSNKKKADILDLANKAGYHADETLLKSDLISNFDVYLQRNATRLQNDKALEPYFATKRPSRPRESIAGQVDKIEKTAERITSDAEADVKSAVKKTAKKASKVKAEAENATSNFLASPGKVLSDVASRISSPFQSAASAVKNTPAARRASTMARDVTIPASPGEVAEEIERAGNKLYAGASDLYSVSGIPDTLDWVRTTCSSVVGVQGSILLLEAYALQKSVFPWRFAFDLPGIPALHIPSIAVKIPDLFVLLTSSFWGPTILWSLTSIFLPLIFAYFYNLTVHPVKRNGARVQALRYPYDPMIFSIAKTVITLLVYGAHRPDGYVDVYSAAVIESAIGWRPIVSGCLISGIAAIWEATQR